MPIYKTEKGYRVQVNYTDSFGNKQVIVKQNKSTATLKQAKQVEADILSKINMNSTIENKNTTMSELYDFYTSVKVNEVKESTLLTMTKRLKNHVIPYFRNKRVQSITTMDLQSWKNEMLKKNLSIEYMNDVYAEFNKILNFAEKHDIIYKNPLKKIGLFKAPGMLPKEEQVIWSVSDFNKFSSALATDCKKLEENQDEDDLIEWGYYVMYNIMFYCGCRKGEVYALTWNDVDIDKRIIKITKNLLHKVRTGGEYLITTPKTKSSIRNIPLPMKLVDILKEHKDRYSKVYGFNDDFYVCGGIEPLTDTKLSNLMKKYARQVDIAENNPHGLRHSHASVLIKNKVDILAISKRLGHSSPRETLETYAHMFEETGYEVADLIDTFA